MKKSQIALLVVVIAIAAIYFFVPSVKSYIDSSVSTLSSFDLNAVYHYLQSYEHKDVIAVVSFFLMILQSIIAPVPAFLITLSNALIFGWAWGALLSWSSAMVGAAMCFYIARILGRDVVEKITGKRALQATDEYFTKYGKHTIMVCRLLPFVSFDLVSYAAGLTSMRFWSFFWATGLGQLPATLVYSYFGQSIFGTASVLFWGLMMMFAFSIVVYVAKNILKDRKAKKLGEQNT
ncbi:TVP38/TMEM64 family protein [Campylobacter curvus]|uniref:TVP38/TMEM64 family protein n=1 Tax=Campylobacter curvus TaxID=200 RepID=UPI000373D970|nr:TVP38/TMEM64 family protein [Campylobacter curvus]QKF62133.1 YdjX family membrane protein (SNARE domain) [Campylobacter curvus]UEB50420.1 TVP38/TMEM64 family protein [Campylobacter curvus]